MAVTAAGFCHGAEKPADADSDGDDDREELTTLAAYNVKTDRIEDFGIRVWIRYDRERSGTFWPVATPLISSIVPNTAAARAGLKPGDRIIKSDGKSAIASIFSQRKWQQLQERKWAEVATGKKNVTWTLEIEPAGEKSVTRVVKLMVPTPAPHWGAAIWQHPEGRAAATVKEPGPLADRSREILDNGVWALFDPWVAHSLGLNAGAGTSYPSLLGYEWRIGNRADGLHRIFVTQACGRTDLILETDSPTAGHHAYLTSPAGALEKNSHNWHRGQKHGEITPEEIRDGFESEVDFWLTKVGKVSARWPLEVIPGKMPANAALAAGPDKPADAPAAGPRAEQFLKLPPATEAQKALFSDAFGKIETDEDRWAYTETSHGLENKQVTVVRVDPSKSGDERCMLLKINGKPPTPEQVKQWRNEGRDATAALGDLPPLGSIVDLTDVRVAKDEAAAMVFELPLRSKNAEFPADKFQALFRVNKTYRAFEDIAVKMREAFRVAGVVKITEAGLEARFQTLDPTFASQPVWLRGGGAVRVLLVKFARDFEATRTDFRRVEPFEEPSAAPK